MNKRYFFLLLMLGTYSSNAQVSNAIAKRISNTLYNILDNNTGQLFSFSKVDTYWDGTKMDNSKCDNVIYIKQGNEFFKRNYENGLNIKWFGCNESRNDNQVIINKVLNTYKSAYIPSGIFKFSATITVPENAMIFGSGKTSVLKLVAKKPLDGMSVFRGGTLKSFKLDCTETEMDLSAAILINSWNNVLSSTGELKIRELVIVGNYPKLQGVALKLHVTTDLTQQYSLIAFCKFNDIDIYGFRDGIFCEVVYKEGKIASFINANIFENIIIYNCLRPIQMINSAEENNIVSGKSNISSNFFKNVIIQHAVGKYPAIFIDGGSNNEINAQFIDWQGFYVEVSKKSPLNIISSLPNDNHKIKFHNSSNKLWKF